MNGILPVPNIFESNESFLAVDAVVQLLFFLNVTNTDTYQFFMTD